MVEALKSILQNKISRQKIILISFFCFIFLFSRLPKISTDEINPDGVNWHYRMQQFVIGLKTGQLEKTYQHYHPGVTLMWIAGIPVEIYKQITGITVYDMNNFQSFHLVAKTSVVLAQLALSILGIYLLSKVTGFRKSFLTFLFLSLEPFFLGNSRMFHMDVLLALFVFNTLLFSYLSLKSENKISMVFAGIFLSLSFLTKSIGIGVLLFVVFYAIYYLTINKKLVFFKIFLTIIFISFVISLFVFFPALFKGPVYYLSEIFSESERVGVRDGHGQIIMGEYTREAGLSFYPLVLLMKVSPFILLGILFWIIYLFSNFKKIFSDKKIFFTRFTTYLLIFYLGYFVVMSFPTKKIDRYMIPIYPLLSYLAVIGFEGIGEYLKKYKKQMSFLLITAFIVFVIIPDIKLFPYPFTYTSPLFGSSDSANKVIAQKPFGIGIFELKKHILNNYGDYPKLGFIDVKPIEAIYPNSKVFDIRVTGPGSYDYIVLAVNENMPDKIRTDTRYYFEKSSSVYINGLEFWRVYAKKTR